MSIGRICVPLIVSLAALASAAPAQTLNGCDLASAEARYDSASPVDVVAVGFTYSPACLLIRQGQDVRWTMSFSTHPLNPGEVVAGVPQPPAPGNPIQVQSMGSAVTFGFADAGAYPYYCGNHFSLGMFGAVFVTIYADGFEDESLCDWSLAVPAGTCP